MPWAAIYSKAATDAEHAAQAAACRAFCAARGYPIAEEYREAPGPTDRQFRLLIQERTRHGGGSVQWVVVAGWRVIADLRRLGLRYAPPDLAICTVSDGQSRTVAQLLEEQEWAEAARLQHSP
jgi:hypothetical protein